MIDIAGYKKYIAFFWTNYLHVLGSMKIISPPSPSHSLCASPSPLYLCISSNVQVSTMMVSQYSPSLSFLAAMFIGQHYSGLRIDYTQGLVINITKGRQLIHWWMIYYKPRSQWSIRQHQNWLMVNWKNSWGYQNIPQPVKMM